MKQRVYEDDILSILSPSIGKTSGEIEQALKSLWLRRGEKTPRGKQEEPLAPLVYNTLMTLQDEMWADRRERPTSPKVLAARRGNPVIEWFLTEGGKRVRLARASLKNSPASDMGGTVPVPA